MIHCVLPVGDGYGWGVCGRELTLALAARGPVRLWPVGEQGLGRVLDPLVRRRLAELSAAGGETPAAGDGVPHPLLHAVAGVSLQPAGPPLRGRPTVGYTFFEDELPAGAADTAARHYDLLVAGSTWCEERLREAGVERTASVLQGIDPARFRPRGAKRLFGDRFVVFSGGKLELRKGQDLVIRAFAELASRHPDALLVAAWYNPWPASLRTLASSPHLEMPSSHEGEWEGFVHRLVAANGVDPQRVIVAPPLPNSALPALYRETDVGLFPNRCEGGTNLVLMEYMACARPVIAADNSGHRDVLSDDNALLLRRMQPLEVRDGDGELKARWSEPDLEEVVERLEWAYRHRDELAPYAARAAEDMARRTWERTAGNFLELAAG